VFPLSHKQQTKLRNIFWSSYSYKVLHTSKRQEVTYAIDKEKTEKKETLFK